MQKLPETLYHTQQIKELERLAIEKSGLSGFELMSRAGYQLYECMQEQFPTAKSLAIFCGGGNNAGDGYVLASLAVAAGWNVSVYSVCDPGSLTGDALMAYQSFIEAGGIVRLFQAMLFIKADVFVDALLGTGLNRNVDDKYAEAIEYINNARTKTIAVDIPSGLNADTGAVMGQAVKADCTLTFIGLKCGLFTGQAADYCGTIFYASLAVPKQLFEQVPSPLKRLSHQTFNKRMRSAHKGDFGHVLVVGGEQGYSGAVRLAAEAALRVGAGLVSVATRPAHAGSVNIGRPELMCHGVAESKDISHLIVKASVIVVGPGLGQTPWAEALFALVAKSGKLLVVDADALNLLAKSPQEYKFSADGLHVLTPHVGEAARLLKWNNEKVSEDRFAAVTLLQENYGGVSVLKGAGTLIANGQSISISSTGNPGMASGGMGDVLSGVIGGLLAQGLPLPCAAEEGVYIHGLAADLSAKRKGERGMLASDLMPYLRKLVNS